MNSQLTHEVFKTHEGEPNSPRVHRRPSRQPSRQSTLEYSPDEVVAAEALLAAVKSAEEKRGPFVASWGGTADSIHESLMVVEYQHLIDFLQKHKLGSLVSPLTSNNIKTVEDLKKCSKEFLCTDIGMEETEAKKILAAVRHVHGRRSRVMSNVKFEGTGNFKGSYEEVEKHEARQAMPKGTVIERAKNPKTRASEFLAAARAWPEELTELIDPESATRQSGIIGNLNKMVGKDLASTTGGIITGLGGLVGRFDDKDVVETTLTTTHLFLSHCPDLTGAVLAELHSLNSSCLTHMTNLGRTPVHHVLGFNKCDKTTFSRGLVWALYEVYEKSLVKVDALGNTPLDLYFKHNDGVLDPTVDNLVRTLCIHCKSWGLDALAKSTEGHRAKSRLSRSQPSHEDLPERFKVLLNGGPYDVEDAVRKMMGGDDDADEDTVSPEDAVANLKFLFVVLPLRAPSKYGLDASHGLMMMARVFTTTADIFAGCSGPGSEKWKALWMECFVDAILSLVDDEGMLKGMTSDVPSRASIEALASSELMSIILTYKYQGGPIILFWLEFFAFMLLFGNLMFLVTSRVPLVGAVIGGMVFISYFTLREAHLIYTNRKIEMEGYRKKSIEEKQAAETVKQAFESFHIQEDVAASLTSRRTQSKIETAEEEEETKDNAIFSTNVGSDHDVGKNEEEEEEEEDDATEEANAQSDLFFGKNRFRGDTTSRFLNEWLFLSYAWRSNVFNWISLGAWISGWAVLVDLLAHSSMITRIDRIPEVEYGLPEVSLHVTMTALFCLKFLGYVKGVSIKTATFILMVSEVLLDIDMFLVVFFLMILMFAVLYHLLFVDDDDESFDAHNSFGTSLWHVWLYSLGEVDDAANATTNSYFLFTAFALVVVIIMMNILIAIVSDSYASAMSRSTQMFWRARVELISEYEPLLPKVKNPEDHDISHGRRMNLRTWQARCFHFQEGLFATILMCGLVLFEIFYIGELEDDKILSEQFYWSLGVTVIFILELVLRMYVWHHTFHAWTNTPEGSFFTNPFRAIDVTVVVVDVGILLLTVFLVSEEDAGSRAKSRVKLARAVRFARASRFVKGLRAARVLRSCRFAANFINRWRRYARPTRAGVMDAITSAFESLEEESSWAGRIIDPERQMKKELERSSSQVLRQVQAAQRESEESEQRVLAELARSEAATAARLAATEKVVQDLANQVKEHLEQLTIRTQERPKRSWCAEKEGRGASLPPRNQPERSGLAPSAKAGLPPFMNRVVETAKGWAGVEEEEQEEEEEEEEEEEGEDDDDDLPRASLRSRLLSPAPQERSQSQPGVFPSSSQTNVASSGVPNEPRHASLPGHRPAIRKD